MIVQAFGPELLFNDKGVATFRPLVQHFVRNAENELLPVKLNFFLMKGWIAYFDTFLEKLREI